MPGDSGFPLRHFASYPYHITLPRLQPAVRNPAMRQRATLQDASAPWKHNTGISKNAHRNATSLAACTDNISFPPYTGGVSPSPDQCALCWKCKLVKQPSYAHTPSSLPIPNIHFQSSFFGHYVLRDRLDEPPSRTETFSTPRRRLTLYTWNIENLVGIRKYEQLQSLIASLPLGIYSPQETKSTHTDLLIS